MFSSHAACVAGVCVISVGRLIPNTGPAMGLPVAFPVVVVVVLGAVVVVIGIGCLCVLAIGCNVARADFCVFAAAMSIVLVEEGTDEVVVREWFFTEAARTSEELPSNFDALSVSPRASSEMSNVSAMVRRGTNPAAMESSAGFLGGRSRVLLAFPRCGEAHDEPSPESVRQPGLPLKAP